MRSVHAVVIGEGSGGLYEATCLAQAGPRGSGGKESDHRARALVPIPEMKAEPLSLSPKKKVGE
jgi:hypothetical protein